MGWKGPGLRDPWVLPVPLLGAWRWFGVSAHLRRGVGVSAHLRRGVSLSCTLRGFFIIIIIFSRPDRCYFLQREKCFSIIGAVFGLGVKTSLLWVLCFSPPYFSPLLDLTPIFTTWKTNKRQMVLSSSQRATVRSGETKGLISHEGY